MVSFLFDPLFIFKVRSADFDVPLQANTTSALSAAAKAATPVLTALLSEDIRMALAAPVRLRLLVSSRMRMLMGIR